MAMDPGQPENKGLPNSPQRSRDAIKDTFDYKKYLKFPNDKRYHKLRKQRAEWGGNIFNTSSRQKVNVLPIQRVFYNLIRKIETAQ